MALTTWMGRAGLAQQHKELLFTDISNVVNTDECWILDRPAWESFIKMEAARTILLDTADFFCTESYRFSKLKVEKMCEEANKVKFTDDYQNHFALLHHQHDENLGFCLRYAYSYNIIAPKLKVCFPNCFPFLPA